MGDSDYGMPDKRIIDADMVDEVVDRPDIDPGDSDSDDEKEFAEPISGWLEKKGPMNRWQRRWVLIAGGWMLWSAKRIAVGDVMEPEERAKFQGSLQVMIIQKIEIVSSGKTQRKFSF